MDADINSILSSLTDDDMEQLRGMASQLFGGEEPPKQEQTGGAQNTQSSQSAQGAQGAQGAGAPPFDFSGIDPEMLHKIMKAMSVMNSRGKDSRCELIEALKPHLSGKKKQRADEAMQMLRLLDIMPLLGELGKK